jgi:hypothetical protein
MAYTQVKNRYLHLPWTSSGSDWNGNHSGNGRVVYNLSRSRTGDRNPKWRDQVRAGANATTPMTGFVNDLVSTQGYAQYKTALSPGGNKFTLRLTGELAAIQASFYPIDWSPMSASVAYNRGLTSYLKAVHAVNQSFSGLIFLGEMRETLRMIRNPAQGLRNILDAYVSNAKRMKRQRPHQTPKEWKKNLGSAWLEYAFGIVPLVSDIKSIAATYNRMFELPRFVAVEGYGREDQSIPSRSFNNQLTTAVPADPNYFPKLLLSRKSTDVAKAKFRGFVRQDCHATPAGAAVLAGFDPYQFIPAAWELLPWSFLIDYFSNIGDVLETSVVDQSKIAWTNVSVIVKQTSTFYCTVAPKGFQQGSDVEVDGKASTATATRHNVARSTPASLGVPTIQLELPGLPAQWANMTALFAQANAEVHPQRPPKKFR